MRDGYLPKDQRKKILLLSDDLRLPSGVGHMSKEIVAGTCHRFNWVQLGGAVHHPEMGKVIEISEPFKQETGVDDPSVKLYPYVGYGDPNVLRNLMMIEKPDAILHFTDPRFWLWLYSMEHEIREHIPLMYYHVWDNLPYPKYNEPYYRSCDFIASISKLTHNLVRNVWQTDAPSDWQLKYIPHGVDSNKFYKIKTSEEIDRVNKLKKDLFNGDDVEFVVTYVNRNVRRKMTGSVILAYRDFFLSLSEEQRKKTRLLLKTNPVDDHGTDLIALIRDCAPEIYAVFAPESLSTETMNDIYNISDVVINLANAEGFGIGTLEAIMAETMIIANVTGGMQDQCGFKNDEGEYLHEDVHYTRDWGSNHDGRYTQHGEWAIPVFPSSTTLIGSPPTPYIYDDNPSWQNAAEAIKQVYAMGRDERARRGRLGREYALSSGFSSHEMSNRFIDGIETVFENWKPRKRFKLLKA